ncbi:protein RALF-like 33 [Carex littledalei]|uniref:Protein RALF-like 33 n=1 Tax=Carex littledalei TaxID=544730 RepID=A0A833VJY2_9POAL|nr:protein RALF-like 33 [Carex littledalei]
MAIKALFFLLLIAMSLTLISASSSSSSSSDLGWVNVPACRGGHGKLGECLDLELGISSSSSDESNRRILANSGYIGYDALRRDSTPCSQRGASYYNCRPGAQANPYSRGCSAITQCRG